VPGALAPEANLGDADIAVRAGGPAPRTSVKTECGGANGGCLEEVTACEVHNALLDCYIVEIFIMRKRLSAQLLSCRRL
jgi:hypothetical protein